MRKIKIICTLGPSSFKKSVLAELIKEKSDIFRINLSHTPRKEIKNKINYLKKNKVKNICIDTEGAQLRTTITKNKSYFLKKGSTILLLNQEKKSDNKKIFLYPNFIFNKIPKGTMIDIGFNNLTIKTINYNYFDKSYKCKVVKSGILESKKGVHLRSKIKLPPLTDKDIYALNLAKQMKINKFAISFVNNQDDILKVKNIVGKNAYIISKIETKNSLKNLKKIAKVSSALLIDRGDLSRYIKIEEIPKAQFYVIKKGKQQKKPTFVATNLLETMIKENLPTRAESHDIYATLRQGADGLVLAAETAIGKSPLDCVKFLKRGIKVNNKKNFF